MKQVIENEYLRAEIEDFGAEPVALTDKRNGREVLWNGDAAHWSRHAPILFPNVGRHYHNCYRFEGKTYPSKQHGFARDMTFTCVEKDATSVTHCLKDDATTREDYPFSFELRVTHRLEGHTMAVVWRVRNLGQGAMPFTIGGHPAFALEEGTQKTDYCLRFPQCDHLTYVLVDPEEGHPMAGDPGHPMALQDEKFPLDDAFFAQDARIFDGAQFDEAIICRADGTPLVGLSAPGFPSYGIWSKPQAPFICLEPWVGRTDDIGFEKDITQKPGIVIAQPGDEFVAAYTIDVFEA